jgi:hypothetical protein
VTFCVPVRGARQRARLPAVQTTPLRPTLRPKPPPQPPLSLCWSPWPRRLLIGFRPTAARLGSSVRCVCAAGCYAPLTASREGPPWAFGTGTSTRTVASYMLGPEVHASVTCVGFTTTRIHSFIGKRRAWFHPGMRKRTSSRFAGRSRRTRCDRERAGRVTRRRRTEALTERRFAAFTTPSDELRHAHSRTALRRRRCARLSAPLRAYYAPRLAPALEVELYTRKAQLRTRAEACAHAAGGR